MYEKRDRYSDDESVTSGGRRIEGVQVRDQGRCQDGSAEGRVGSRWPHRLLAGGVALATLVATGLTATAAGATTAPGVTSTQINTGAISTLSGPIASDFESLVPGIRAYFDMVNAQGGIDGRRLSLTYSLDDGGNPSQFNQLAHTLINQDHVFAVSGIATAFFSPNYFVATNTPTYGYNVVGNWAGPKNLFAAGGSGLYYPAEAPFVAYLAKKVKAKSIAAVSYGIAASSASCQASINWLKANGYHVGYTDLNIPYPASGVSSDVQRMQEAGTSLVLSCMDITGNIALSRAIQQYGLKTDQLWLNGNDQNELDQYPTLMKGVYFTTSHVPFTAPTQYYPGLKTYLTAMQKYSAQVRPRRGRHPGMGGRSPAGGGDQGRREQSDPGQRDQPDQQDHRLHRRWSDHAGQLGDHRPRRPLRAELCGVHPGAGQQVRLGVRPWAPGVRLLQRRQERRAPAGTGGDARGLSRAARGSEAGG